MNNPCEIVLKKLAAPFPPNRVSWRVGSTNGPKTDGMALAYIDARDVMERLDSIFGINWQCRYSHAEAKTVCEIGIKVGDEWIWRSDGAGNSDVEAEKGALSDAFKRAAVRWGVGRYLYDIESPWVKIEQKGRSYVIAKSETARLQKLLPASKIEEPEPEPPKDDGLPQVKNERGVSEARKWVKEYLDELRGVENAEQFVEKMYGAKTRWVRMCQAYPGVYQGPDGSGLRGEAMKISMIVGARDDFDTFVNEIEQIARETQQQAAE
jgi:hypothetical protein